MAATFRRLAIGKMSKSSTCIMKTKSCSDTPIQDSLMKEFLQAREELKTHFENERREIIDNYERRVKYLRTVLEEYETNNNLLKGKVIKQEDECYILKKRIAELEKRGYHAQICSGDKYESADDKSIESSFEDENPSFNDNHRKCREEFQHLLNELKIQKQTFREQWEDESIVMQRKFDDEKLQLEKVLYKQLNQKLEKEIKRKELLCTEKNHLQKTISQTIIESIIEQHKNTEKIWKEANSDSGADVENASDEESTKTGFSHEEIMSGVVISKILQEQKLRLTADYQKHLLKEKHKFKLRINALNREIFLLSQENETLRASGIYGECVDEVGEFHNELTRKLLELAKVLEEDGKIVL